RVVQKPATEGRLAMKCAIQAVKTGKGCGGIDVLRGLPDNGTVTQANASKFTAEWPGESPKQSRISGSWASPSTSAASRGSPPAPSTSPAARGPGPAAGTAPGN